MHTKKMYVYQSLVLMLTPNNEVASIVVSSNVARTVAPICPRKRITLRAISKEYSEFRRPLFGLTLLMADGFRLFF